MADATPVLYEGMFLINPQVTAGDLNAGLTKVREVLERAGAEIVSLRKWDERKLAYPIRGQKRGTFLLALFRVAGAKVAQIERDCNLSDEVLRVLVIRGDHYGEIEIEQEIKASQTTADETRLREAGEADAEAEGAEEAETVEAGAGESDEE